MKNSSGSQTKKKPDQQFISFQAFNALRFAKPPDKTTAADGTLFWLIIVPHSGHRSPDPRKSYPHATHNPLASRRFNAALMRQARAARCIGMIDAKKAGTHSG